MRGKSMFSIVATRRDGCTMVPFSRSKRKFWLSLEAKTEIPIYLEPGLRGKQPNGGSPMSEGHFDHAGTYAAMADGELLALARDPAALTDAARPALREEMKRRGLGSDVGQENVLPADRQRASGDSRTTRPFRCSRIKQILLQQYIGAIVSALIAAQAISRIVSLLMMPVTYHLLIAGRSSTSVLGQREPPPMFDWNQLITVAVNVCLELAMVYGLVRWLYYGHSDSEQKSPLSTDA
jgi:hypothetical protein